MGGMVAAPRELAIFSSQRVNQPAGTILAMVAKTSHGKYDRADLV